MSELETTSNDLKNDPRIAEARKLIGEAIREHSGRLNSIRPPKESLRESYDDALTSMGDLRGGGLYYRYLGSGLGNGPLVELADGSVKYDMISGIGVHIYGHTHPEIVDSLIQAAISDTVMQGNLQQNLDSLALCDDVVEIAQESGANLKHCFLSTSGATANENALKMMFQKRFPADRVLTFQNSFSGRTIALAQLTDRPKNRDGLPTTLAVDYVPFFDANNSEESTAATLAALHEHLERYPNQHAGMCLELIQGEGGYYSAPREYFVALLNVLKEHDIPIWFDEVQTFGRTSRLFAFQHLELDSYADVVTIGKMSQVCATLFTEEFKPRPGLVSQTFTGATSSIHAARWILKQFREGGYLGSDGRNIEIHHRFAEHFERISQQHPEKFHGPWGLGGMVAFTVFDGSSEKTKKFLNQLFEAGVIAFPAGVNPTRVRMLPPLLVIEDRQIDAVCKIIEETLSE